ncbi:MAG: corrinoid protein [Chloroflexota bacterium]|nr:MAG: corrinoid protein [Chloroflexota bacterium]
MVAANRIHLEQISKAVVDGDRDATISGVQAALESNIDANTILQDALIPAMSNVGRLFEEGEYFVPEMLIAARAMKSGLELLKPLMISAGLNPKGRVALGTVQGDLHDIGKNLVGIMLEGAGFAIYDMGTDVSPERVVEVIKTEQVDLVGLSALLTTTMPMMDTTIQAISNAGIRDRVKVIIGGAPITQEYAEKIGADGFAPDASQATKLAVELIGEST